MRCICNDWPQQAVSRSSRPRDWVISTNANKVAQTRSRHRRGLRYTERERSLLQGRSNICWLADTQSVGENAKARGPARPALLAEDQRALPTSRELAIYLHENFLIDQRAVHNSPRPIDAVAVAQSVETVRLSGVLSSRKRQCVDDAVHVDRLAPEPRNSSFTKPMSNSALWMISLASPMKARNSSTTLAKIGLSLRKAAV